MLKQWVSIKQIRKKRGKTVEKGRKKQNIYIRLFMHVYVYTNIYKIVSVNEYHISLY